MKLVVQRVGRAAVRVGDETVASIGRGLLLLLAVELGDGEDEIAWCADKVLGMRIFSDDQGKMNLSVEQAGGSLLVVSQFTLVGSLRRGRRPSFEGAAPPPVAEELYGRFAGRLEQSGIPVGRGVFGADMEVELVNDGPVTILLDSAERLLPRQGGRR